MASSEEDNLMDSIDDGADDLFGDVDADDTPAEKERALSDRELDSGDDEDRKDRAPEEAQDEDMEDIDDHVVKVLDLDISKHHLPKPSDGEINTLRLPAFLGIDPRPFDAKTFKPPASNHHTETKSANFSASAVSASTMRYRLNESSGKLESNTVVYKWSDGSVTVGIGEQHYELQSKPLAPPSNTKTYQEVLDSHSYIAAPSISGQLLYVVGHMTNQFTVRPNKDIEDDALEKLQRNLAVAARGNKANKNGPELINITQDPELEKKRAEIAEKERIKAQRRRENAAEKANAPRHAVGRGGLNVDDLEGRSGRRAAGPGRQAPKQRRRRPEYDSDDELPRGRHSKEDEYDKEDDFLASSDEELEEGVDDDEEEEMLDDESDREMPKAKKQKLSKPEEVSDADADADAEADLDDEDAPAPPVSSEPANRGRKRNIIEDDDDE